MPIVALAGRPNVGKSSLFNRLIGRRKALVWDRPGVTRDIIQGRWKTSDGEELDLWDMAGWDRVGVSLQNADAEMSKAIDLIIVVVDGSEPLTAEDREGFRLLRKLHKPIVVALNKRDKKDFEVYSHEVFEEFKGQVMPISAEQKLGIDDLEDLVLKLLPKSKPLSEGPQAEPDHNVLILGRPNVGKSSLMNQLAGKPIALVADQPGTTRDTLEYRITKNKETWQFRDSAGVRKKGNIYGRNSDPVEIFSVQKALKEIDIVDYVLFVIEANETGQMHAQDKKLLHILRQSRVPALIVINKWDIWRKAIAEKDYRAELRDQLGDLQYLSILFVSAKTGFHCDKIFQIFRDMSKSQKRISTNQVNQWLQATLKLRSPRVAKRGGEGPHGKTRTQYLNLSYAVQTSTNPMSFQIFANAPHAVADEDRKFLEAQLRSHFKLQGLPIRLVFRKKV